MSNTNQESVSVPVSVPAPMSDYSNKENWQFVQQNTTINNYPRPQGSLPMFNWGLKSFEQSKLSKLWSSVLLSKDS